MSENIITGFSWQDEEEPERWIEHTKEGCIVFKKTPRKFNYDDPQAPGFDKDKISVVGAYHAAAIFLNSIWERYKDRFSEKDFDAFSSFMGSLCGAPTSIEDWRACYWITQGRDSITYEESCSRETNSVKITLQEAFNVMLLLSSVNFDWLRERMGPEFPELKDLEFPQLIEFLENMRDEPENHKEEWNLWFEAIERVRQGEEYGYE